MWKIRFWWKKINNIYKVESLKPESASILEKTDQGAIDVGGHEGLDAAEELAADEDGGDGGRSMVVGGGEGEEEGVDVGAGVVLVDLDDGGADAEAEKKAFDDGAHTAGGHAEHNDGVARCKLLDDLVGPFLLHLFLLHRLHLHPRLHHFHNYLIITSFSFFHSSH